MPVCTACCQSVQRTVKPDTKTVERCPHCGRICDTYEEFGDVQIWIDVLLLRREAWAHVLFNKQQYLNRLVVLLICCAVEALVVNNLNVLRSFPRMGINAESSILYTPEGNVRSLQLVRIFQCPLFSQMSYSAHLPQLFISSLTENMLVASVATWLGYLLHAQNDHFSQPWFLEVAVASHIKLCYCLFLIWTVPPSLLPVVDFMYIIWFGRALTVLTFDRHWFFSILSVASCIGVRCCYRSLTQWAPQVI